MEENKPDYESDSWCMWKRLKCSESHYAQHVNKLSRYNDSDNPPDETDGADDDEIPIN